MYGSFYRTSELLKWTSFKKALKGQQIATIPDIILPFAHYKYSNYRKDTKNCNKTQQKGFTFAT